jgi:hypothetical protein
VDEASDTRFIHENLCWQATEAEQPDLLTVQLQNAVAGVWQSGKGQIVFAEIGGKGLLILRTHNHYRRIPLHKRLVILAQLRQVLAAEGSEETAVEDQQDMLLPPE